jgi:hypothetical protein
VALDLCHGVGCHAGLFVSFQVILWSFVNNKGMSLTITYSIGYVVSFL